MSLRIQYGLVSPLLLRYQRRSIPWYLGTYRSAKPTWSSGTGGGYVPRCHCPVQVTRLPISHVFPSDRDALQNSRSHKILSAPHLSLCPSSNTSLIQRTHTNAQHTKPVCSPTPRTFTSSSLVFDTHHCLHRPASTSTRRTPPITMGSSTRPPKKSFSSGSSASSYSSSDSDSYRSGRVSMDRPVASIEIIRCMRCAREVEMTSTDLPSMYGMVTVGTGIFYCSKCARATGYS